ncbi:hypothetical protein A5707_21845 [Mycobacterium kyorinense]|uniref:FAD-binding domain-containing protein n=1 Tax=Mycobacterium kyorinense TaxID=487514 RepID=A0A1A2Z7Q5_9MYCO|nr:hypothetical protein A5707_21845 [Mycobacterium kyorinense]
MSITTYFPDSGDTAAQFTVQHGRQMLLAATGESIDVEVVDVAPWQPYERVADQFRSGRVFLVGDSAHTMPPFKAGGANTAIQSAHNLAWKLAAVLNGTAGPGVLATCYTERHPVGRFNARQSLPGPALSFTRLDGNRPQLPAAEEAPMFALLAGCQYRSAAVFSDGPMPSDPDVVALVEELRGAARYPSPACVGGARGSTPVHARFGQAWLHVVHRCIRNAMAERGRSSSRRAGCLDRRAQYWCRS